MDLSQTLLSQWIRYRQFYVKGISSDPISPNDEAEFLETTSSIAQCTRKLGERINEKDYPFKQKEISALIKGTISVAYFRTIPAQDQKNFYKEWHIILIYLSRTVGALKFLNEGYIPPPKAVPGKKKKKMSGGKKAAIVIAVLAAAAAGYFFLFA